MNTDTGQIATMDFVNTLPKRQRKKWKMIGEGVVKARIEAGLNPNKIGRNEPCPCGSGAKFKRCCCTKKGRP